MYVEFTTTDHDLVDTLFAAADTSADMAEITFNGSSVEGRNGFRAAKGPWQKIEVTIADATLALEVTERTRDGYVKTVHVTMEGPREAVVDCFLKYRKQSWGFDWTPEWSVTELVYETNRPHLLWCQNVEDAAEAFFQNTNYGQGDYIAAQAVIEQLTIELSRANPRQDWQNWAQMRFEEEMECTNPPTLPASALCRWGYNPNVEV